MQTAVLIAGAGPTGLTLAIELARRNITFRIVDAASKPFFGSRGKGIQPRTLEVFEDLGVLDAIRAAGGPYPRFRVHVGSLSVPAGGLHRVVAPSPSVPFPNLWMVPQWRTEQILRARLEELGGQVEFGSSVTGFEQDRDGVTATLSTADGIDRVCADYLVGCDGGHSFVRHALGVGFEGESMPTRPVVFADVEIDGLDRRRWHVCRWPRDACSRCVRCRARHGFSWQHRCVGVWSHLSRARRASVTLSSGESGCVFAASDGPPSFARRCVWSIATASVACCSAEIPRMCIHRRAARG